jgi:hypothetical protein
MRCWLLRAKLHLPMYAIKDLDDSWKFILKRKIIETERGLRMLRVGWMLRARVLLSTCVRNFVILPFKALEGIWICLSFYLFIFLCFCDEVIEEDDMRKVREDRYAQWKSLVPALYDWLTNHHLMWPSLSCRYVFITSFSCVKSRMYDTDVTQRNRVKVIWSTKRIAGTWKTMYS